MFLNLGPRHILFCFDDVDCGTDDYGWEFTQQRCTVSDCLCDLSPRVEMYLAVVKKLVESVEKVCHNM